MKLRHLLPALLAALALAAPGPALAFSGHKMWTEPIRAQVGHHVSKNPIALKKYQGKTSSQRGCTWGNVYEAVPGKSCTRDLVISGSMPPGLAFENCTSLVITGTPSQPGTWRVTLRLPPFRCPEGVTRPQNVELYFYIKGFAPRRVD